MEYQFVKKEEKDAKAPTIQERFIEIYYEQDSTWRHDDKYWSACTIFTNEYNLQPPYTDPHSFKVMINYRIKHGNMKK